MKNENKRSHNTRNLMPQAFMNSRSELVKGSHNTKYATLLCLPVGRPETVRSGWSTSLCGATWAIWDYPLAGIQRRKVAYCLLCDLPDRSDCDLIKVSARPTCDLCDVFSWLSQRPAIALKNCFSKRPTPCKGNA